MDPAFRTPALFPYLNAPNLPETLDLNTYNYMLQETKYFPLQINFSKNALTRLLDLRERTFNVGLNNINYGIAKEAYRNILEIIFSTNTTQTNQWGIKSIVDNNINALTFTSEALVRRKFEAAYAVWFSLDQKLKTSDMLEFLTFCFENTNDSNAQDFVSGLISQIDNQQIHNLITKSIACISKLPVCRREPILTLQLLASLSKDQLKNRTFINKLKSLAQCTPPNINIYAFFTQAFAVPHENLQATLVNLFSKTAEPLQIFSAINTICDYGAKTQIILSSTPLLERFTQQSQLTNFFQTFAYVVDKKRILEIIDALLKSNDPLPQTADEFYQFFKMAQEPKSLPFQEALAISSNEMQRECLNFLSRSLATFPEIFKKISEQLTPNQIHTLAQNFGTLFLLCPAEEREGFLKALTFISPVHWNTLLITAIDSYQHNKHLNLSIVERLGLWLISHASQAPEQQQDTMSPHIQGLFYNQLNSFVVPVNIQNAFKNLQHKQLSFISQSLHTIPWLELFKEASFLAPATPDKQHSVLTLLMNMQPEEKKTFLDFFKEILPQETQPHATLRFFLIRIFQNLNTNEKQRAEAILRKVAPLLANPSKDLLDILQLIESRPTAAAPCFLSFLYAIKRCPYLLQQENIGTLSSLCTYASKTTIPWIFENLSWVHPAFLTHLLHELLKKSFQVDVKIHQILQIPSLRAQCVKYWAITLQKLMHDPNHPEEARELALRNINSPFGNLPDQFRSLIDYVMEITDPAKLHEPTNPYGLWKLLKHLQSTEAPVNVEITTKEIAGYTWDLNALREMRNQNPFKVKDLTLDIPSDILTQMLNALTNRVKNLSDEQKRAISSHLNQSYAISYSLDALRSSIVNKTTIPAWLEHSKDPEAELESTSYYLHKIIEYLLQQSNERENALLSPQELTLIVICDAIRECSTGQEDGIQELYNKIVPNELKIGSPANLPLDKINIRARTAIQTGLSDTFMSTNLMTEIVGGPFGQSSHQHQFARNRHSHHLGLRWTIAFDPHSGLIVPKLIEEQPEPFAQKFLVEFSSVAINEVKKAISQALEKGALSYMNLQEYFEEILPASDKNGSWQERFIQFNEELEPTGISDEAAKAILAYLNFLKPTEIPNSNSNQQQENEITMDENLIERLPENGILALSGPRGGGIE